ncbi:MAG: sulfur carrier protein ThiS [Planctomycetes bacterium]|nr:sulfur carrier protein ThiS [Planctomycetota bacterium]
MQLTLNGVQREVPDGISVSALLESLAVRPDALAVEVNRCVVPRSNFDECQLRSGDRVEIVTLVGGG